MPETDRIYQFMGPKTDIMGERYYFNAMLQMAAFCTTTVLCVIAGDFHFPQHLHNCMHKNIQIYNLSHIK